MGEPARLLPGQGPIVETLAGSTRGLLITSMGMRSKDLLVTAALRHPLAVRGVVTIIDERVSRRAWQDAVKAAGGELRVEYVTPQLLVTRTLGREVGELPGVVVVNGDRYGSRLRIGAELRALLEAADPARTAVLGYLSVGHIAQEFARDLDAAQRATRVTLPGRRIAHRNRAVEFATLTGVPLSQAQRWTAGTYAALAPGEWLVASEYEERLWKALPHLEQQHRTNSR